MILLCINGLITLNLEKRKMTIIRCMQKQAGPED